MEEARVRDFVARHYRWPGVLDLHRAAVGLDLLRAPVNVLLAFPAFLLQFTSLLLSVCGFRQASLNLLKVPRGIRTRTERELAERLRAELISDDLSDAGERLVERYAETRRASADLVTALFLGLVGWVIFDQFTPGSLSAGRELADSVTLYNAIDGFFLGETVGGWYYGLFPPETPVWVHVIATVATALGLSLVATFSGLVADPLQSAVGLHQRRLRRWLEALEHVEERRFRPLDPYAARIVDLVDLFKGL